MSYDIARRTIYQRTDPEFRIEKLVVAPKTRVEVRITDCSRSPVEVVYDGGQIVLVSLTPEMVRAIRENTLADGTAIFEERA